MAVMTAKGLVGKITLVTPFTSEVELLYTNNPNYRVSAMVLGEKEAYGLIEGFDKERNELIMKRIDSSLTVKEGEKVVSSGLGGIFPKGVPIGEITEVSTDDFGLTKMAYVKPSADFSILENVVIAKRTLTVIDGSDGDATNEDLSNPQKATVEGKSNGSISHSLCCSIAILLEPEFAMLSPIEVSGHIYYLVPRFLILYLIFISIYYSRQRAVMYGLFWCLV